MTPLRVLVVDDEPLARRRLEQHLARLETAICIGTATGCADGEALIAKLRPDVVLLDIRMRDGSGFDLVTRIDAEHSPSIIFVTAFDRHAVEAFEASATDFLVKPVEFSRLQDALEKAGRAIKQRNRASVADELEELVENLRAQMADDVSPGRFEAEFWVRHRVRGFIRIEVNQIRWMQSEDDYVRLVTGQGSHLMRGTLKDLEARLDPQQFVRIHRSTIVRLSEVERYVTISGNMEVVMACGTRLRVGRPQAKQIRATLSHLERAKQLVHGHPLQCFGNLLANSNT